jgi:hypothetical protein
MSRLTGVLIAVLSVVPCVGQVGPTSPAAGLKGPPYDTGAIWKIWAEQNRTAVPTLRRAFSQESVLETKKVIAATLIALGERGEPYSGLLTAEAEAALNNDIPIPDGRGVSETREYQQTFESWQLRRGMSKEATKRAFQQALGRDLDTFFSLSRAKQAQFIPLLRRALHSNNFLVVLQAAQGLVALEDRMSVPLIIAEGDRRPQLAGALASSSLVYFVSSDEAQRAVERFIPDAAVRESFVQRARTLGPAGVWK